MKKVLKCVCAAAGLLLLAGWVEGASTPGSAEFQISTKTYGGSYNPKHVLAIWVTDDSTNLIKTLRANFDKRFQYLTVWRGMAGTRTNKLTDVDGVTGATLANHSSPNPVLVSWNCQYTNGVTVPDGYYRFFVEFSEHNGTGRWITNGIRFYKGTTNFGAAYADQLYFTNMAVAYTAAAAARDLAVLSISPSLAAPNSNVTFTVVVTNLSANAETFAITLNNNTTGEEIGSRASVAVAGNGKTNVTFTWNTAGYRLRDYQLQADVMLLGGSDGNLANNSLATTVALRNPAHDVAASLFTWPLMMIPNTTSNVVVRVTNGDYPESFAVLLRDATAGAQLGSNYLANFPANAQTNLTFAWNASGAAIGYHTLQAIAKPVAGEWDLADNTNELDVAVASGATTVTLIASNAVWRYNDTGNSNLYNAAWKELNYYDALWSAGPAPLGYSNNTLATIISPGPVGNNKYPSYYFRHQFPVNFNPVSVTLSLRYDDGIVAYLNSAEIARGNMPAGEITYGTWASSTSPGYTDSYTNFAINPLLFARGLNQMAVEVHQGNATSSDVTFGLIMTAVVPNLTPTFDVAITNLEAAAGILGGEQTLIAAHLVNRGNSAASGALYLVNTNNGQLVATQAFTNLAAGAQTTALVDWKTLGLAPGDYTLQAFTVVNGVTNWAGAFNLPVAVTGGVALNAVKAAGGLGGRGGAVEALGNSLFVGVGSSLLVFDASQMSAPVLRGSLRLPGVIEHIAASGTNVFASCGPAGVQVMGVSNFQLTHLNTIETAGHAYMSKASGSQLFVAAGRAGLKILNIANPAAPVLAGAFATEGPARAVAVSGNTAYLADQYLGLLILNVSTPASPVLLGASRFDGGFDLHVSGSYAYVVDAYSRLRVVNLSNPTAPTVSGSLLLTNVVCRRLSGTGASLCVGTEGMGLIFVNAANPAAPVATATNAFLGDIAALATLSPRLIALGDSARLQITSYATPSVNELAGVQPLGTRADAVVVDNNLAYVAAGENGLLIYSVTNPALPALVGSLPAITNARSLALVGTTVYVGEGQGGFKIADAANPAAPILHGSLFRTNIGCVRSLAPAGSKLVFTDGAKVYLADVSTPTAPALLASLSVPGFAGAVAVSDTTALVAAGAAGVLAFDCGGVTLSQIGAYNTPGFAAGLEIIGNHAYVADGPAGWLILDIGTPSAPSLVATHAGQGPVNLIGLSPNTAYLAVGGGPLQALDVTAPLTPVARENFGPLVNALKLSASDTLLAAAEGEAGAALLGIGEADANHNGLPDGWEQQIVDASKATNGPIQSLADVRAEDDFDGDGLSNLHEYLAGTSPIDPQSVFAVQSVSGPQGAAPAVIRWHSVAGKVYNLYKSTDLSAGFTLVQGNIPATPPINSYTNAAGDGAAFFMLSVP